MLLNYHCHDVAGNRVLNIQLKAEVGHFGKCAHLKELYATFTARKGRKKQKGATAHQTPLRKNSNFTWKMIVEVGVCGSEVVGENMTV